MFVIREATPADAGEIAAILEPILRAGETYALPRDWSRDDMIAYWHGAPHVVFVAEEASEIVGTYFLQPNQRGGGAHVANCGFATRGSAVGRGVARAMCVHSLHEAARRGFRAMQYNLVVSTNERAVRLWTDLGFAVIGRIPGAFAHPTLGDVDALVMYRSLTGQ